MARRQPARVESISRRARRLATPRRIRNLARQAHLPEGFISDSEGQVQGPELEAEPILRRHLSEDRSVFADFDDQKFHAFLSLMVYLARHGVDYAGVTRRLLELLEGEGRPTVVLDGYMLIMRGLQRMHRQRGELEPQPLPGSRSGVSAVEPITGVRTPQPLPGSRSGVSAVEPTMAGTGVRTICTICGAVRE